MKYPEFMDRVTKNPFVVTMKDHRIGMEKVRDDIIEPKFFKDISHLEGIDIL